eukprot:1027558_1
MTYWSNIYCHYKQKSNSDSHYNLGNLFLEQAKRRISRALELDPNHQKAHEHYTTLSEIKTHSPNEKSTRVEGSESKHQASNKNQIRNIANQRWHQKIGLLIQNDAHILKSADTDIENNVMQLMERVTDRITKSKLQAAIDKTKFMFLAYMGFYTTLLVVSILVFGGFVSNPKIGDIEIPLILTVNIIGSFLILLWVTCQSSANIIKCWRMKSLYTPLIAHLVDTASDLGAIYIYYQNWQMGGDEEFSQGNILCQHWGWHFNRYGNISITLIDMNFVL